MDRTYQIKTLSPVLGLSFSLLISNASADSIGMVDLPHFAIDQTEVTISAFKIFSDETGFVTEAERSGGGLVFEAGWKKKLGWTWRNPYGLPARDDEPAVHITFDEASAYCHWAGKRLPTESEWVSAAYTEQRLSPPAPFERGKTYPFPTGDSPAGANCLNACGDHPAVPVAHLLDHGAGHAPTATTTAGVNGLYDMGANVW
ncbi:MAG: SUMF1/EgtB/PvdO family nonheme iron enzyme, partial [Arenicellales bacterium]